MDPTLADRHERGSIGNAFLRDAVLAGRADGSPPSMEESLIGADLDHQVRRRLGHYLVAGFNGTEAFADLIGAVMRLAVSVLLSQGREEIADAMRVECRIDTSYAHVQSAKPQALGGLELNGGAALGVASAAAGPVVRIAASVSEAQLVRMCENPWVLPHLMRALETVVPLHLDFVIEFSVRAPETGFRLASATPGETSASRLGLTTVLHGGLAESARDAGKE
jgi:hypothetical protein